MPRVPYLETAPPAYDLAPRGPLSSPFVVHDLPGMQPASTRRLYYVREDFYEAAAPRPVAPSQGPLQRSNRPLNLLLRATGNQMNEHSLRFDVVNAGVIGGVAAIYAVLVSPLFSAPIGSLWITICALFIVLDLIEGLRFDLSRPHNAPNRVRCPGLKMNAATTGSMAIA